jgi:hypothetical protein
VLPLVLITALNHQLHKPDLSKLSQSSLAKEVDNIKVPKGLFGRLPKNVQKQLSMNTKQGLAKEAGRMQQKYVQPQIVKYQKGRFIAFAGIGALIIIVLFLGRYQMFAWGLSLGGTATIVYAYIDTWPYLDMGFKWLAVPTLLIILVFFCLQWISCNKR